MKWTDLSSSFVHLEQGGVLIASIKCVDVNIHCTRLKPSKYDTIIIQTIIEYIKSAQITQGLL